MYDLISILQLAAAAAGRQLDSHGEAAVKRPLRKHVIIKILNMENNCK